jgi:hypothetical protein
VKPSCKQRYCSHDCADKARIRPPADRFWEKVDKGGECWLWTGGTTSKGYGCFYQGTKDCMTHRFSYEPHLGLIPAGLCVLHRCDQPRRVNPAHLFPGTLADNNADMAAKGRSAKGERLPAARLTPEKVRQIRAAHAAGTHTQAELARRFGVTHGTIYFVVERKTWRYV